MTAAPLSTKPWDVAAIAGRLAHIVDARSIAPGVVRLFLLPGQAVLAQAALIQVGYDVARVNDAEMVVTLPEPIEEEPAAYTESGELVEEHPMTAADPHAGVAVEDNPLTGEIRHEPACPVAKGICLCTPRYWTAAEIAELRDREAAERAEVDAYLAGARHVADRRAAQTGADALTPAHFLAAATGHPSGAAIRAAWPAQD